MKSIADMLMPIVARYATVWPSAHAQQEVLLEQMQEQQIALAEWTARAMVAEAEAGIYRDALIEIATIAGGDVSGGVPSWPSVDVWATEEVAQLRKDCDE